MYKVIITFLVMSFLGCNAASSTKVHYPSHLKPALEERYQFAQAQLAFWIAQERSEQEAKFNEFQVTSSALKTITEKFPKAVMQDMVDVIKADYENRESRAFFALTQMLYWDAIKRGEDKSLVDKYVEDLNGILSSPLFSDLSEDVLKAYGEDIIQMQKMTTTQKEHTEEVKL